MSEKYNKDFYKELKNAAKEAGVRFVTRDTTFDGVCDYNGVSLAYMNSIDSPECRMIEVSVSYCAPEDTFKPKHGKFQALNKLAGGESIQLPLAEYYRDYGAKELESLLFSIFTV